MAGIKGLNQPILAESKLSAFGHSKDFLSWTGANAQRKRGEPFIDRNTGFGASSLPGLKLSRAFSARSAPQTSSSWGALSSSFPYCSCGAGAGAGTELESASKSVLTGSKQNFSPGGGVSFFQKSYKGLFSEAEGIGNGVWPQCCLPCVGRAILELRDFLFQSSAMWFHLLPD